MQDTGRSPLHLLLDDRASRDGACGFDRRRRARGPARQPRTLRRQKDQGRLGKEGRHRVQEAHRQHHARTGHDGRVHAQAVRTARDAGRWGQAREPADPAGPTAAPRTRVRRTILPMSASAEAGRTCACWPTWRTGASPAIPSGGPGTRAWCRARSPPSTSRWRTSWCSAPTGAASSRHGDRRAARRVRHQRIVAAQGQSLRQRRGRIDGQAAEEGARVPEPLRHDRAAEA